MFNRCQTVGNNDNRFSNGQFTDCLLDQMLIFGVNTCCCLIKNDNVGIFQNGAGNGMMCGMCEAHVNDAVRKACPVKKVSSSRSKNQTVILSETELDTEVLMNAIRGTGYEVGAIQKEPYKKRGLFG